MVAKSQADSGGVAACQLDLAHTFSSRDMAASLYLRSNACEFPRLSQIGQDTDGVDATSGMLNDVTHDCDRLLSTQVIEGCFMNILLTFKVIRKLHQV